MSLGFCITPRDRSELMPRYDVLVSVTLFIEVEGDCPEDAEDKAYEVVNNDSMLRYDWETTDTVDIRLME
jgi:hypothetical protein